MKRKIVFVPFARLEFEDAVEWYEDQREGLGDKFKLEVNAVLEQILVAPERFRCASPDTRKAILKRFPYRLYFMIEPETIKIVSVFHGARNPGQLRLRLR